MAKKVRPESGSEDEDREEWNEEGSEEEPDFADPEGFVDDITDDDLMPDLMPNLPKESDGVDSVIVVDGVPSVGAERVEKLKSVINKIFTKFGAIVNEHYPVDEAGKTKGYIFLEFANQESAMEAVKNLDSYKLDKQHTFLVNMFSDFDKYLSIPEQWEPPTEEPYEDQGNLKAWLMDNDAYDQFCVVAEGGERVSVCLHSKPEPQDLQSKARWTETYVKWSPLGTYMVTFHSKGIALWGAQDFHKIQRFSHIGVQFIDFSPCENYLVTFSPPNDKRTDEPYPIIVWEVRTGVKKRSFKTEGNMSWPIFKWSHDGTYFGRMSGDSSLSIYETPSFGLLDKKSIKVSGMMDFSWSPSENTLAYWVAEDKDVPARVTLLEIPSRNELRVKNLFNVADCRMHWQKSGDYICVKVDRYSKLRKEKDDGPKYAGLYCNFEIFHMREKQIPVDSVEIKENVQAFAWEPVGSKFAIIHGESQSLNVSFYGVKTGQTPALLKKYERKTANNLFWSPSGQFVVLAGLRTMNGVLEFIDTRDFTTTNNGEHFMCTDVEWDPTGRYLMTGVSWWGHKVDNAYWVWSFQGKLLKKYQCERFCQFQWRPRPATLLSKKQIKEVKNNLPKKYSPIFETEDMMRSSKADKELIDKRRAKYDKFMKYRESRIKQYEDQKQMRIEMRDGMDTDAIDTNNKDMEEEVVEFLVNEEETVLD